MKWFCAAVVSLFLLSGLSFGQPAPRPHSIFEEAPPADSVPVRVTSAPSTAPARHAVPAAAEQAKAEQLLKELFAAEQKDPSPTARRDLAAKLLMEAERADDPTERFVILTSAKDAAAEGGDAGAINVATQKLAAEFDVDALLMKVQALKLCMPKAEGAAANGEVGSAALIAWGRRCWQIGLTLPEPPRMWRQRLRQNALIQL